MYLVGSTIISILSSSSSSIHRLLLSSSSVKRSRSTAIIAPASMEDDSVILFSEFTSPRESTSPSSSFYRSPSSSKPSINLSVTNLSYTVHPSRSFPFFCERPKPIYVLKSVSFSAKNSQVLAIVGPSGTGKSTLLRIIAGRMLENEFDPRSIRINNEIVKNTFQLRKICGFVAQEDNLLPLLTVRETLMYSAKFRLSGASGGERKERVDRLMKELGLSHVAESFVGDEEERGISGGERKRVSIGVDIINDPPILLLDEPTSGLDSSSALQIIELLSSLAKSNQTTVILSIHQPSYRVLQHIHKFLILSHGSVVHHGSLELLEKKIAELEMVIPIQLNPLEFAMEIITSLEEHSNTHFHQSAIEEESELNSYPQWLDLETAVAEEQKSSTSQISRLLEILFLCSRFIKIMYRTKQLLLARTMQALVGGLGLGSVFIRVRKAEDGVGETLGLFAFSLSFLLSSTVEALPIFLQERRVIMKEASRGAYKISSYMIANAIVFLPFLFAVAVLFSLPVYWLAGLNPSVEAFTFFTLVVWVIVLMASSLVLFLSAVSPDFITGNSLICTVLGAFFLFSGYFIPKENIPNYWIFMYYVSLYKYPLDCLIQNEYWSSKDECFLWNNENRSICLMRGVDVLKSRGLESDTRLMNMGIMLGFFVFYRLICWIILSRKVLISTI